METLSPSQSGDKECAVQLYLLMRSALRLDNVFGLRLSTQGVVYISVDVMRYNPEGVYEARVVLVIIQCLG